MDLALFDRISEYEWHIKPFGKMRVPGVIFASDSLPRPLEFLPGPVNGVFLELAGTEEGGRARRGQGVRSDSMEITDVKVIPVDDEKLKAFVSIVFDQCFVVTDI